MSTDQANDDIYLDSNGCPTERIRVGGQEIVVHYDDIPESDITTVRGLRCTTPIRTVIDLAPEMPAADLERIIRDFLNRGLFTVEQALARTNQPDMAARVGAHMVRSALCAMAPGDTPVRVPKPRHSRGASPAPEV
jgi:Lon protease-like protein